MAPILQTIASLDSRSGGTSTCTYDLVKALNASGMPTDILPPARLPGRTDGGRRQLYPCLPV